MIIMYNAIAEKTVKNDYVIYWDARRSTGTTESVDDYGFKLLWSFDPMDGYLFVQDSSGNDLYVDGAVGPLKFHHDFKQDPQDRDQYYIVRAINKATPSLFKDTPPLFQERRKDGIIDTIIYSEMIMNELYIGEPFFFLKRKSDGTRCPECWNPIQFRRMKTHCTTCNGTGFFDGFYKPYTLNISVDASPRVSEVGQTGENQLTMIRGRMSSYPLVNPRDLLVSKDMARRYIITRVDGTKLPNIAVGRDVCCASGDAHTISQILTMSEIAPNDSLYNVDVVGRDIVGWNPSGLIGQKPNIIGHSYDGKNIIGSGSMIGQSSTIGGH